MSSLRHISNIDHPNRFHVKILKLKVYPLKFLSAFVVSNLQTTLILSDIRELFECTGELLVARFVRLGVAEEESEREVNNQLA